jgi:hypothetical protein
MAFMRSVQIGKAAAAPVAPVGHQGSENTPQIDAIMLKKPVVFGCQNGAGQILGNLFD